MTDHDNPDRQPAPDFAALAARDAARTPEHDAERQAHLDSWQIGTAAMALGEQHLAAGDLTGARSWFEMAAAHQALDAQVRLATVAVLTDAISAADTAAAGTPLATTARALHQDREDAVEQLDAAAQLVLAAQARADRIVAAAEEHAASITADAQAEADLVRAQVRAETAGLVPSHDVHAAEFSLTEAAGHIAAAAAQLPRIDDLVSTSLATLGRLVASPDVDAAARLAAAAMALHRHDEPPSIQRWMASTIRPTPLTHPRRFVRATDRGLSHKHFVLTLCREHHTAPWDSSTPHRSKALTALQTGGEASGDLMQYVFLIATMLNSSPTSAIYQAAEQLDLLRHGTRDGNAADLLWVPQRVGQRWSLADTPAAEEDAQESPGHGHEAFVVEPKSSTSVTRLRSGKYTGGYLVYPFVAETQAQPSD